MTCWNKYNGFMLYMTHRGQSLCVYAQQMRLLMLIASAAAVGSCEARQDEPAAIGRQCPHLFGCGGARLLLRFLKQWMRQGTDTDAQAGEGDLRVNAPLQLPR
jgi:hypothetical protein